MDYASEKDIREELSRHVVSYDRGTDSRSQLRLAKRLRISTPMLSQILSGQRSPNKTILRYLGYDLQPYYRKRL